MAHFALVEAADTVRRMKGATYLSAQHARLTARPVEPSATARNNLSSSTAGSRRSGGLQAGPDAEWPHTRSRKPSAGISNAIVDSTTSVTGSRHCGVSVGFAPSPG
jgi:hypothetical protein